MDQERENIVFYKPPLPYTRGSDLKVRSHNPPPPTPVFHFCCTDDEGGRSERKELNPVERCLLNPPLKGLGNADSFTVDLEIVDMIHVGEGRNAQVVTVRVSNISGDTSSTRAEELRQQKGSLVVAKLYDPLYFDDDDGYLNPFRCVDKHYTHEAAAYTRLADLQGTKIPKYYGSYTLYLPVSPEHPQTGKGRKTTCRLVRLVLIEFMRGLTMWDICDPKATFSKADRQRIMRDLIDFDSELYARDIQHCDLHPRNVIITTTNTDDSSTRQGTSSHGDDAVLRSTTKTNGKDGNNAQCRTKVTSVTIIDFGSTEFGRIQMVPAPTPEYLAKFFPGVYISPLLRWHGAHRNHLIDYRDWICDWEWQEWLEREYEYTRGGITEGMERVWAPVEVSDEEDVE